MGDSITRMVAEGSMVMHIMARVYKYRLNSRLRWTEEMLEDSVENLRDDTKERMRTVLNEAREKITARRKHFLDKSHKNSL